MEFRTFDVRKILSFDWRGFAPSPHQKKRNLYKEYYLPIHLKNAVILHKSQPIYINPIIIQRGLRTQSQLQVITLKTLRVIKVICKRLINTHNQVGILKLNFIFSFFLSFDSYIIYYFPKNSNLFSYVGRTKKEQKKRDYSPFSSASALRRAFSSRAAWSAAILRAFFSAAALAFSSLALTCAA